MLRLTDAVMRTAPSGRKLIIGFIDPNDLPKLKVDTYQREALPVRSLQDWLHAFEAGEVPPIDLGSRSSRCTQTATGWTVAGDDIFVVDGLQRKTVAEVIHGQGGEVCLPVVTYLSTTREWEIARFRQLNTNRVRVNTNVLLRNAETYNAAIKLLVANTTTDGHVLSGRVQWTQTASKGTLLTAVSLVRVAGALHSHFATGLLDTNVARVSGTLEDLAVPVGLSTFERNLDTFFGMVAKACRMGDLESARNVVHLRMGYLMSLATLFAGHTDFWHNNLLIIPEKIEAALIGYKFDPIEREEIASRGRNIPSLVDKLANAARKARRKPLTQWS